MFDLETFREDLYSHLGVDEDDFSTTKADRCINRSYAWLLDEFKFRTKEKSVTFTTTVSERNYDLPDDFESLRGLSIEDLTDFQHSPLDRMTIDEYEKEYRNDSDEENKPTHYNREGVCLRLWPTPDNEYKMTLKYNVILPDLGVSTVIDGDIATLQFDAPKVPKSWEEMILLGAVWRALLDLGDIPRASQIEKLVEKMAFKSSRKQAEAREEVDSHRAGLEVILPEYRV